CDSVNLDFLMTLSRFAGRVYYSAVSEAGELTAPARRNSVVESSEP
ncbi:hypothetical protein HNQ60_000001, partial [Povalibacter uvarum]|nr:hypothetical protein [Povalibacter uvarum]